MSRYLCLFFLIAILVSCNSEPPAPNRAQIEGELWEAVEARFYTWRDNDYEAHMATYHPDWRRWALHSQKLMQKEDFSGLWKYMKDREAVVSMELEPVEFTLLGDGNAAVVHFISTETYRWIAEDQPDGGKQRDSIYIGVLRWSDVLVKEDDEWLVIGGHRDRSWLKE